MVKTYQNVLDIIFTHENGQLQTTLPLSELKEIGAFESKGKFENTLLLFWKAVNYSRPLQEQCPELPKLLKISYCIYVEYDYEFAVPEWYNDQEGKFYYS